MNNNIYDILKKFNGVTQEPQKPATQKQSTAKTQLQENMEQVLSRKLIAEKKAKPDYIDLDKDGNKKEPMKKAAKDAKKVEEGSTGDYSAKKGAAGKDLGKPGKNFAKIAKGAAERYGSKERGEKVAGAVLNKLRTKESAGDMDESALQAYLGKKKYGADGMKALQQAGRDGASKEKMAKIRASHDKMDEVAPPGEKAERMVKHIKKGYAKDGKLTPKEKGIAYATAWKAHNKGKVEEAIRAMMEAGFTKEQIVEGWDEMMKSVKDRAHSMKTGEKRAGAKGEIEKTSTGVKHTRRYDPKTGETEIGSDGEQVKRGRGRPKKTAFESRSMAKNMIVETFTQMFNDATAPIQPKDAEQFMKSSNPNIFNKLTGTKPTVKPEVGTIKQGTFSATPPKAGEQGVKVPQNPEVAKEEEDMEEGNYFSGQLAKARAAGKKQADLDGDGDMEQVREEENLDESKCMECGMYESKCKCDKVDESLNLFRKLAGLKECMSPISGAAQDMQDSQGKMNINTSMDSDGHKSVTITADGDAAGELMQMLKLAGMGGHEGHDHAEPEAVMVVGGGEQDQEVDEAKDERYHANTTPEEEVMPVQQQTKGGNGDVAGQEKKMTKHGYQFGDNPEAMKESMSLKLIKEYEGIKVKK